MDKKSGGKMNDRERELEELMSIICIFTTTQEATRKTAEKIQNLGYTKQHFPIEELKAWLEEELIKSNAIIKELRKQRKENFIHIIFERGRIDFIIKTQQKLIEFKMIKTNGGENE